MTVITHNPKYCSDWYRIELSIPSLYCGAKCCRSGSNRMDFSYKKLSLKRKHKKQFCRPIRHAGNTTLNVSELLEKDYIIVISDHCCTETGIHITHTQTCQFIFRLKPFCC